MLLRFRDEYLARSLVFEPEGHVYRVDGVRVFSCSDVVRTWHRLCGRTPREFEEWHSIVGRALHDAIEADIRGRLPELDFHPEIWREIGPKLDANRRWREISGFEPMEIEHADGSIDLALEVTMWHPSGVGGEADALALVFGKPAVVDWKSSYLDGVEIQTAGYELMAQFVFDLFVERRWALGHLAVEDVGRFRPKDLRDPVDRRIFQNTLGLMNEAVRRTLWEGI